MRSNTLTVAANSQQLITSSCNAGEKIVGIGYFWGVAGAGLFIRDQFFPDSPPNTAAARGINTTANPAPLTLQALCVAA